MYRNQRKNSHRHVSIRYIWRTVMSSVGISHMSKVDPSGRLAIIVVIVGGAHISEVGPRGRLAVSVVRSLSLVNPVGRDPISMMVVEREWA
jgi:hypothetical protein